MSIFDGNLKQRLIGAVVLIVLAVVFLPMIFNNKGEKLPETVVTVPLEPTKPAQPATQPTPDIVTTTSEPITTPNEPTQPEQPVVDNNTTNNTVASTTPATTTEPASTAPTNSSNNSTTAPTTATKPVVSKPDAQGITASWTIQVAAVSNLQNADAFTNKLRKANYNAYTRTEGNIHRVFVGPFIEKAEATRVQQSIEKQFKEKGIVREFKPEKK